MVKIHIFVGFQDDSNKHKTENKSQKQIMRIRNDAIIPLSNQTPSTQGTVIRHYTGNPGSTPFVSAPQVTPQTEYLLIMKTTQNTNMAKL